MPIVSPPLFLISTNLICWWCGDDITVVGIVARDVVGSEDGEEYRPSCDTDDFFSLTNIESLPAGLLAEIQAHSPTFGKAISFTAKPTYFANYCACCNALQGDHYVHSEPDQGFFPTDEADCVEIQVRTLNYADRFQTTACVASSTRIQRVLHRHLGLPDQ